MKFLGERFSHEAYPKCYISEMRQAPEMRELELLHSELDKQRDRYGRKEASKNTRGLVLIGASAIFAAFRVPNAVGGWNWLPTAFALAAVILGVLALRPAKGDELDIAKLEAAIRHAPPYKALLTLYRNKARVHSTDLLHLESRSRLIAIGFWIVLAGLVASVIEFVLFNVTLTIR